MSAYINEFIKGLNKNARDAILATAAAENGRVPYTVHDRTVDALSRRYLIREVNNRNGGFNWCILTTNGKRVAAELKRRAEARQPAQGPAPAPKKSPARKELSQAERTLQYADAAQIFAALHPAARAVVDAYQRNALDTIAEGGPRFSPSDIWGHIGGEPGVYLKHDWDTDPNEWATPEGFNKVYSHLDRLATAGKVSLSRWDELVTEARDLLRQESHRTPPVVLEKDPGGWQVLFATKSSFTGERWADMPVVSVKRTSQLRAGHDWDVVERRLDGAGLSRYGFPRAVSAGHALNLARKRWEAEGPHAAWFRFLAEEAPAIEELRETYAPTPTQEREAFEFAQRATADGPMPELSLADLQALAHGHA
ncbi:hypothetical protein ACFUC2_04990 [[Kitasatospora] papulosa]|uniref:hypothetical protein n=1 Tax=[Kitasatospora] papulosa TaxID=1464011 RepID=UPI0036448681